MHCSTVIAACDRGGAWDICLWMLEEAREERAEGADAAATATAGARANVFAYTAAISACGKAGRWEEAVSLLDVRDTAKRRRSSVNIVGFPLLCRSRAAFSVVEVCCRASTMRAAQAASNPRSKAFVFPCLT